MPTDKLRGTWQGPQRDTVEEAKADIDVVLSVLAKFAPMLLSAAELQASCEQPTAAARQAETDNPVPGGEACNAKSRG